jgi:hypothetical protein
MGFLSKLMKNPIVQMALPMALTGGASALFGGLGTKLGIGSLFSGMNPLMANALKQTALGYGTAALSGSRRPGRAAMAAGLTSIPFSYLSAANAAKGFNEQYGGMKGQEMYDITPAKNTYSYIDPDPAMDFFPGGQTMTTTPAVQGFRTIPGNVPKVTPMGILTGQQSNITLPPQYADMPISDAGGVYTNVPGGSAYGNVMPGKEISLDADIFSKAVKDKAGDIIPGEFTSNFLPTAVSQAAGLYAGRDTPEEEFEAAKRRRRKELAFLYGVDESLIEGEMDNPFYTGAMMNAGGIASLNMDMGGNVSGPGGPKDDMIDAKLSDGEFVMTAKAVENFGNGSRMEGAKKMYQMMNKLDPESETMSEV